MAADMSGEQMQAKITAARREAEGLKDKIKRRKDELADTSRTTTLLPIFQFSRHLEICSAAIIGSSSR